MTSGPHPIRAVLAALISLLIGAASACGQESAEPPAPRQWEAFYNLRHAAGYRKNVLLSHFVQQDSPLLFSEIESVLVRLPSQPRATEVSLFLVGQDIRYLGPGPSNKDQSLIATAQIRQPLSDRWSLLLESYYAYLDQIFDVSVSFTDQGNLKSQVHQGVFKPGVRYQLGQRANLDLNLDIERSEFLAPADDDWAIGPQLSLRQEFGDRSEWRLSYEVIRRVADTLPQTDLTGAPIPGTTAARNEHEFEFELRHYWDEAQHWRTVSKLEAKFFRHTGSAYYDYDRYQFSQEVRYRNSPWEVSLRARLRRYNYDVQPAEPGTPVLRLRDGLDLDLRVERRLAPHWKVFLVGESEFANSNRPTDDYNAHLCYAGIDREF